MPATEADLCTLVDATDAHFAWMLGEGASPHSNLRLPPDGVDAPGVLRLLRAMTGRLKEAGCRGSWLIVAESEVVGICGYKMPPTTEGKVEIGYGIAPGRRDRGYASCAVRAVLKLARLDRNILVVSAATTVANVVSQRVLERNGFAQSATSYDPDDGMLIWWQVVLA